MSRNEEALKVASRTVGDVAILSFAGDFDAASDPSSIEDVDALIAECKRVIFNFSGLTFVNSSALGYLLKTVRALRDRGGELVFSEPAKCFWNILEVYGVGQVFAVYPDDQAALQHFGQNG